MDRFSCSALVALLAASACLAVPLAGIAAGAQGTSNAPGLPPSGLMQPPPTIRAGTTVQTTQTLHGKSEVQAYLSQARFDTASFRVDSRTPPQQRTSPFDSTSHSVSLKVAQSLTVSRDQSPLDLVKSSGSYPSVAPDGVVTLSWTSACVHYTATYTAGQAHNGLHPAVMTASTWEQSRECSTSQG